MLYLNIIYIISIFFEKKFKLQGRKKLWYFGYIFPWKISIKIFLIAIYVKFEDTLIGYKNILKEAIDKVET